MFGPSFGYLLLAAAVMSPASVPASGQAQKLDGAVPGDPVLEACLDNHGERASCECVAREAGSRFSSKQLTILAAAIPEISRVGEPQSLVDELGLSLDDILNLRRRVATADLVIRQACGIGFDAGTGDHSGSN